MGGRIEPQPADYPEPTRSIAPVVMAEDRSMAIPPGALVKTAYVETHRVKLACQDRMAVGDVNTAYQRQLQLGDQQRWPCPRGHWDGAGWFVIVDGRHQYVAALMLGLSHVLVAWVE